MDMSSVWLVGGIAVFFMLMGGFYAISPKKIHVVQSLWSDLLQRITIVGLVLAVAFLGWSLLRCTSHERNIREEGSANGVASVAEVAASDRAGASSVSPADAHLHDDDHAEGRDSTRIWRVTLWINLCLALPWITAFATRYVLALKSNAASFALLSGYVVVDMALGMTVGMISFVGWSGVAMLVGLMALSFGYNYWSCELVSRLWLDGDFGRRRRG